MVFQKLRERLSRKKTAKPTKAAAKQLKVKEEQPPKTEEEEKEPTEEARDFEDKDEEPKVEDKEEEPVEEVKDVPEPEQVENEPRAREARKAENWDCCGFLAVTVE